MLIAEPGLQSARGHQRSKYETRPFLPRQLSPPAGGLDAVLEEAVRGHRGATGVHLPPRGLPVSRALSPSWIPTA